jgi:hypothetical protein
MAKFNWSGVVVLSYLDGETTAPQKVGKDISLAVQYFGNPVYRGRICDDR